MTPTRLAAPFPAPPREVRRALEHLEQAEEAGLPATAAHLLDRPWDPAACARHVRAQLWPWLDEVAAWLNRDHAWQTVLAVPACWPRHPFLVHELAVLACLRAVAGQTVSPHGLEDWHRYALPGFHARMADRLGAGCAPGRHTDWPARSWATAFTEERATGGRRALFADDLGPAVPPAADAPGTGR
jgi:hypothetical protein